MLQKITRAIGRIMPVYRSWRGAVALVACLLTATTVLLAVGATPRGWLVVGLSLLVLMAGFVLFGLEVARQDRLRAQIHRENVPGTTPDGSTAPYEGRSRAIPQEAPASPLVSVIVVAFNDAAFVSDCLGSIQAQTLDDWECLVIDNASTDHTLDHAFERFASDPRFTFVLSEENVDAGAARNLGLSMARGKYVTFLDADDFLLSRSLEVRVRSLAKALREPDGETWVAGTYCAWTSVPEDAEYPIDERPKPSPKRERVSWLSFLRTDRIFIASAPILRLDIVRSLGGFDTELPTFEDYEFWSRLLRHGYIVEPVQYIGVAYRQKRSSRYRRNILVRAKATTGFYARNYASWPWRTRSAAAPFHYEEPGDYYLRQLLSADRLLTSLVVASASGDESIVRNIEAQLEIVAAPYMRWVLELDATVHRAATRVESYDDSGRQARVAELVTQVWPTVQRLFFGDSDKARFDDRVGDDSSSPSAAREPGTPSMILREPAYLRSLGDPTSNNMVVLLPSAAYHVDELGPLSKELNQRGHDTAFFVTERHWDRVRPPLRRYTNEVFRFPADPEVLALKSSAVVTLNDWGQYKTLVDLANEAGTPSFAKVEGVQDFEDDDVHWERGAYQTARHILCQGQNDVEAIRNERHVVGSSRLERIWLAPPRVADEPLVVINVNFTYNVLTDHRDFWVDSAVEACKKAGLPYVLSLHPAETWEGDSLHVADQPIRHLLTKARVLISRFSTVPFEAMARGVPFIYHNPHEERVGTFKDPNGAFDITTNIDELRLALRDAEKWTNNYRKRAEQFFLRQVDVDAHRRSEQRTADVLDAVLTQDPESK